MLLEGRVTGAAAVTVVARCHLARPLPQRGNKKIAAVT